MMGRDRTLWVAMFGVTCLCAICLAIYLGILHKKELIDNEIVICSEELLTSICLSDSKNITEYAAGDVLFKLNNFKNETPAEVEDITIFIEEKNSKYALVRSQVDLRLVDGSYDVYWYNIELINKGSWKVFNVMPTKPFFTSDKEGKVIDMDIFKHVLSEYIKMSNQDTRMAITKYTAGQVRQSLEIYVNEDEPLMEITEFLDIQSLKRTQSLVKVDAKYTIDDRDVDNIITFYKTKEGWKIVDLQSSLVK